MRLLVHLADGRKNALCSLDFDAQMTLTAFKSAAFRAALPATLADASVMPSRMDVDQYYLSHNGRVLDCESSTSSLGHSGLREHDTVILVPSLRGGGGDGGSTCAESRSCYLEMYARKRVDKVDPKDTIFARWTNCLLSGEPLMPPCVVDKLGNLLNKEAVLKALQIKGIPKGLRHIRGLRDVIDIKLTEIPSVAEDALVKFHCPVSGVEFNGSFRFFALRCCGNVLSQRALKQLKGQSSCPMCHASLGPTDALPINGTPEEVDELRRLMDEERMKAKTEKAEKKKSAAAGPGTGGGLKADTSHDLQDMAEPRSTESNGMSSQAAGKKVGVLVKTKAHAGGNPPPSDKSTTNRSREDPGTKRHAPAASNQQKRYKAGEHAPVGATKEIYESLFTSSRKEEFKETYSCRSLPLGRN